MEEIPISSEETTMKICLRAVCVTSDAADVVQNDTLNFIVFVKMLADYCKVWLKLTSLHLPDNFMTANEQYGDMLCFFLSFFNCYILTILVFFICIQIGGGLYQWIWKDSQAFFLIRQRLH